VWINFDVDPFGWFSGRLHFSLPDFFSSDDLSVSSPQPGQSRTGLNRPKIAQISSKPSNLHPNGLFWNKKWNKGKQMRNFWDFFQYFGSLNCTLDVATLPKAIFHQKSNFKQSWPFTIWLINQIFIKKSIFGYFLLKFPVPKILIKNFVPKMTFLTDKTRNKLLQINSSDCN